jgi:hypothetical protein
MRRLSIITMLLLQGVLFGQSVSQPENSDTNSWKPRPTLFGGPSLVGSGYQPVALSAGVGILLNSPTLISDEEARYMNARKTNDNTVDNRKGHERYLLARLFYRYRRGFYFGGGVQWSETSTSNYTKQAWRPTFGVGGDSFGQGYSLRWQVLYILKGTDRVNGLQGPEMQLWLPSPLSRKHFFYRQTLGIYVLHTTITDPADPSLTARQLGQTNTASFLDCTFGWRF